MSSYICPECDVETDAKVCETCGTRTLKLKKDRTDPMIGKTLDGRYKIESLIGRGGMGAVYKAMQTSMKKIVAVKLIRMDVASETEAVKRFHREVKAASMLSHPHSIKVFDFGQSEDGDLYMVMEFLDGIALGKALKNDGPFSPSRALKIVGEIAQSLAEAHSVGLVHRDLKPDNVMLLDIFGDPDFVKVLDFGIAKFMESGEASVTRTGVAVGTPHYMAPEQARGRQNLGPAADIYALGIILFELLSGSRPYDSESSVEVLFMHVQNPIPELPDECLASGDLRDILRRMMAKDPDERPTSEELIATVNTLRPLEAGFMGQDTVVAPALGTTVSRRVSTGKSPRTKTPSPSGPGAKTAVLPGTDIAPRPPQAGAKKSFTWLIVLLLLIAGGGGGAAYWLTLPPPVVEEIPQPSPNPVVAEAPKRPPIRMHIESKPPGALVRAGDKELGKTPLDYDFEAEPSTRLLEFELDGYESFSRDIRLENNGRFLATLRQSAKEMTLKSEPAGAIVKEGERILGTTPFTHKFAAETTSTTLVFSLEGFVDLSQEIQLMNKGNFLANLQPAPKPKPRPARPATSSGSQKPSPTPSKPKSDGYKRLEF